jgi:hypothetical protein
MVKVLGATVDGVQASIAARSKECMRVGEKNAKGRFFHAPRRIE